MKKNSLKTMTKGQWIFAAFLALMTVASIVAEFAGHHESHHWWSGIPLFWIWFGAIGCAVLILFGKKVLGPVIYKKEDYYHE
jgi:Mn2+/Fe2+ NRAMP family transporter